MQKIVSIGIICLLLITGSISATSIKTPYKEFFNDENPPITSICFDRATGIVTLIAVQYPIGGDIGVKATYYKIDDGTRQTYTEPFFIGEGTHKIDFLQNHLMNIF